MEHEQLRHTRHPDESERGSRALDQGGSGKTLGPERLTRLSPRLFLQDAPIKLAIVMKVIGRTGSRGQARYRLLVEVLNDMALIRRCFLPSGHTSPREVLG